MNERYGKLDEVRQPFIQILRSLYEQMMPLCRDMAGAAKGIAGLGALFYVAYLVWQSLARAEPIDVFPMLRPCDWSCDHVLPTVVLGTITASSHPSYRARQVMLGRWKRWT